MITVYENEKIKQRLNTFINVSRNITSNTSLTKLVQEIIEAVIESIDKADAGFFLLWNEEMEYLEIEGAYNFKEEMYLQNKLLAGEGISGSVFEDGCSKMIHTAEKIKEAMGNMRNQTLHYYLESTVHAAIPVSCMSVPLIHQNKKIGVLTIDNFKNDGFFTGEDLAFLEAIGHQIAISIVNARAFQEKEKQTKELETILSLHNELNHVALKGDGTFSLVKKLAEKFSGSILYFDSLYRLKTSYPPSEDHHFYIKEWLKKNAKKLSIPRLLDIYKKEEWVGQAIGVMSSFGTIGFLVVTEQEKELNLIGELAFKHAASIMAIEQMKQQEQMKHQLTEKEELLKDILKNNFTQEVQRALKRYGISIEDKCIFIGIERLMNDEALESFISIENQVKRVFQDRFLTICFPGRDMVYVMLASKDSILNREEELKTRSERLQQYYHPNLIYIGRSVDSLRQADISFKDVQIMPDFFVEQGKKASKVIGFREIGYKRYLNDVSDDDAIAFVMLFLEEIVQANKNDWLKTLTAYLQTDKNAVKTAEEMHLHPNTVYYRIQQIEEKLNINLDSLEDCMNVRIALDLYQLKHL